MKNHYRKVFKLKQDERYKARFIIRGCEQELEKLTIKKLLVQSYVQVLLEVYLH